MFTLRVYFESKQALIAHFAETKPEKSHHDGDHESFLLQAKNNRLKLSKRVASSVEVENP